MLGSILGYRIPGSRANNGSYKADCEHQQNRKQPSHLNIAPTGWINQPDYHETAFNIYLILWIGRSPNEEMATY
jgi:hypothetical protein